MPQLQYTSLEVRGVSLHPNRFSKAGEGALALAENVVFEREGLATCRRGMPYESVITAVGTPGDAWKREFYYQDIAIAHVGTVLKRRASATSWVAYSGTYSDPESGFRIRDAQQNQNLYFTTGAGVYKLDDIAATPQLAGVPRPLDSTGSTTGSSGFLADASVVGYRFTVYYTDLNGNELESAPSQRLVVTNTVGGAATRNVLLRCYIPSGLSTSYYWRAYRSAQLTPATAVPSDEMQLAAEGQLSSTDISNGYFETTDLTPDALRGQTLYTSPSVLDGGAQSANDRPPLALDLCVFRGCMFYFNYVGFERFNLALIGASTTGAGIRFIADNVATTNASPIVTSVATTANLRVGMKVKAAAGIPSTARILTIDSGTQITMTVNATATGARDVEFQDILRIDGVEYFAASAESTANKEFLASLGGTASQNLETTSRSIVRVVNANASAEVYGYITSAFDEPPGKMLFEERLIGSSPFQFSSTATNAFSPTLPSTDNGAQVSSADEKFNFAAVSKFEQPEGCPTNQDVRLGNSAALRGLALRDAVIVLNRSDVGIITGQDISNFTYDQLDASCRVIGPETAVVLNDAVFAMTNQGVARITAEGVTIASRAIERDLISMSALSNFATTAFAVSYETDRSYNLGIPTTSLDVQCTFVWRLNVFTNAWSHAITAVSAGAVDPVTDQLTFTDQAASLLRRERKSYSRTDYADDELAVNITSSSGLTVNLTSAAFLVEGDMLVQGSNEIFIDAIVGNALTMRSVATWSNGAATAYRPIDWAVEFEPFATDNAAALKHFTECITLWREAGMERFTIAYATDIKQNFITANTHVKKPATSGGTWTDLPAGSAPDNEQGVRDWIARDCQYARWIRPRISVQVCRQKIALAGIGWQFDSFGGQAKGAAPS